MQYIMTCVRCGRRIQQEPAYKCPVCGGILDFQYARTPLSLCGDDAPGVFRFSELLPVVEGEHVSLQEGGTPLVPSIHIVREVGLNRLFFKLEGCNPTASFKDRGIAVAVDCGRRFGLRKAIIASSGNASASAAAYTARAGMALTALIPEMTPANKVFQAATHGARIIRVKGGYSNAYSVCSKLAGMPGILNLTTTFINPYATEGYKTLGYEIFEQLGMTPDWIVLPVGAGPILAAMYRAFCDLKRMKLTNRIPRLACVQAAYCSPIARAFIHHDAAVAACPHALSTLATGIDDGLSGYEEDGDYTLACIRNSEGTAVTLDEREIADSVRMLAREGIYAEPAAAVGAKALIKMKEEGVISPVDTVVVVVSGHGLKNPLTLAGEAPPLISTAEEALPYI